MSISSLPASGDQLLVSEKFVSLQGEGVSTGVPAAFLRLGNCNLACSFCDTPYTWDEARFDLRSELSAEPVEAVARWIVAEAPGRLIVTGGEPLLQQRQLTELLDLVDAELSKRSSSRVFVEVETNGTVAPLEKLAQRIDQWNVSPKLANSGEAKERRYRAAALQAFFRLQTAYFKFVIQRPEDASEVDDLVGQSGVPPERVLLMPEATSVEALRSRASLVARLATERRYRYSGRLHLELYGGRRGT